MSDVINLDSYASSIIVDAIPDHQELDMRALRETVAEATRQTADDACIYFSDCYEIINRYERDVASAAIEALEDGPQFASGDWRDAMQAHAYNVAYAYLDDKAQSLLGAIEDAGCDLVNACDEASGLADLTITVDCPWGMFPPSRIVDDVHFWVDFEGSKAAATQVAGVWLGFSW